MAESTPRLIDVRDAILAALTRQQSKRDSYDLDGWIAAERQVMLSATNAWREKLGSLPVTESDIRRVEQWACGHSDYSSKFALYCAEIALECGPRAPVTSTVHLKKTDMQVKTLRSAP